METRPIGYCNIWHNYPSIPVFIHVQKTRRLLYVSILYNTSGNPCNALGHEKTVNAFGKSLFQTM